MSITIVYIVSNIKKKRDKHVIRSINHEMYFQKVTEKSLSACGKKT